MVSCRQSSFLGEPVQPQKRKAQKQKGTAGEVQPGINGQRVGQNGGTHHRSPHGVKEEAAAVSGAEGEGGEPEEEISFEELLL